MLWDVFYFLSLGLTSSWVISAETYNYQVWPVSAKIGECVTFEAKKNFDTYNVSATKITWKKDSKPIIASETVQIIGTRFYISYVTLQDGAYYQAIIEDTSTKFKETTDFWLNAIDCKKNELEVPGRTGKCKSSCTEMCPSGWSFIRGVKARCYQYFKTELSWEAAQENCQQLGGQLASIGNSAENEFLGSLIQSAAGAWIGLNDRYRESEFRWNYVKYTNPTYFAWAQNEPDNSNSHCNVENCVEFRPDGYWADLNCLTYLPYVCQKSTSSNDTSGWSCRNSKCLRLFRDPQLWVHALDNCKKAGGKLAEIWTESENEFVQAIIERTSWIGLNDIQESGVYIWNAKNSLARKASFFNWASGEPSDIPYLPGRNEPCKGQDCVQLFSRKSRTSWNDLDCNLKLPYICELLRESHLTTGAIIGITVGSLIAFAVVAGMMHEAVRRHNKSHVQSLIQAAYVQDYKDLRDKELPTRRKSLWKLALRWKRPSRVGPIPS